MQIDTTLVELDSPKTTTRQDQVAMMFSEGLKPAEIAKALGISRRRVDQLRFKGARKAVRGGSSGPEALRTKEQIEKSKAKILEKCERKGDCLITTSTGVRQIAREAIDDLLGGQGITICENRTKCVNPDHRFLKGSLAHWKALLALSTKQEGGCTIWTAYTTPNGYGKVRWGFTEDLAHRVAWQMAYGPIPEGLVIDHLCGNRPCVDPDHMSLTTHQDNCARRQPDWVRPEAKKITDDELTLWVNAFNAGMSLKDACIEFNRDYTQLAHVRAILSMGEESHAWTAKAAGRYKKYFEARPALIGCLKGRQGGYWFGKTPSAEC